MVLSPKTGKGPVNSIPHKYGRIPVVPFKAPPSPILRPHGEKKGGGGAPGGRESTRRLLPQTARPEGEATCMPGSSLDSGTQDVPPFF